MLHVLSFLCEWATRVQGRWHFQDSTAYPPVCLAVGAVGACSPGVRNRNIHQAPHTFVPPQAMVQHSSGTGFQVQKAGEPSGWSAWALCPASSAVCPLCPHTPRLAELEPRSPNHLPFAPAGLSAMEKIIVPQLWFQMCKWTLDKLEKFASSKGDLCNELHFETK